MEMSISRLIYISLIGYLCTASTYSLCKSDHILIQYLCGRSLLQRRPFILGIHQASAHVELTWTVGSLGKGPDFKGDWQARSSRQACFTVLGYHSYRYFEHNELRVERLKFVDFPNSFGQEEQMDDKYSISVGNRLKILQLFF